MCKDFEMGKNQVFRKNKKEIKKVRVVGKKTLGEQVGCLVIEVDRRNSKYS